VNFVLLSETETGFLEMEMLTKNQTRMKLHKFKNFTWCKASKLYKLQVAMHGQTQILLWYLPQKVSTNLNICSPTLLEILKKFILWSSFPFPKISFQPLFVILLFLQDIQV